MKESGRHKRVVRESRARRSLMVRMAVGLTEALFLSPARERNVGGQAVIEGVMMRGPERWGVAVRDMKGEVHSKSEPLKKRHPFLKKPLLRGVVALVEALVLGIKAIDFSASTVYEDEESGGGLSPLAIGLTIGFSLLLGIGLFIFLPLYVTRLIGLVLPLVEESSLLFNLVDGLIRVGIFLLYVTAIGLWKEMRRIYEYHGAEHKVIHAYERSEPLVPERVMEKFSPHHPRCGTSFLLIVMLVSILVFSLIPKDWAFMMKFASRLVLIPLIAGISYEMLKLSAKRSDIKLLSILSLPGLFLQRLTTREPDRDQVEVAIAALGLVMDSEDDR